MNNPLEFLLLFAGIFVLNIIPMFAPPTWMVLAFIGLTSQVLSPLAMALVAAPAATLGRVCLAKGAQALLRNRLLSDAHRRNIDVIRDELEHRRGLTAGAFLFYAFSPLPSNLLFIAFGLTTLPLWLAAIPFFIGRLASYWFFAETATFIGDHLTDHGNGGFLAGGWYFIATQLLMIPILYLFTKLDWKALIRERKLRWI